MPTVAIVEGIRIMIYFMDHPPPHFHVLFAEYRAKIDIETLAVMQDGLPPSQERKVIKWARNRREKLLNAWLACQAGSEPDKIP